MDSYCLKKNNYLLVWLYFFLSPPKKKDHFHRLAGHFAPARYVAMSKNITAINWNTYVYPS